MSAAPVGGGGGIPLTFPTLLATLSLLAVSFALVAPGAGADSCTSLTDETCDHTVCVGRTETREGETCKLSEEPVRELCETAKCDVG